MPRGVDDALGSVAEHRVATEGEVDDAVGAGVDRPGDHVRWRGSCTGELPAHTADAQGADGGEPGHQPSVAPQVVAGHLVSWWLRLVHSSAR
jgi:hypothetical protein